MNDSCKYLETTVAIVLILAQYLPIHINFIQMESSPNPHGSSTDTRNNMGSCPFVHDFNEQVLSTNTRYLQRMMISLTDPAVNKRTATHPDDKEHLEDFEPWMAPDNDLAQALELRKKVFYADRDRTCWTDNNEPSVRSASQQLLELQAAYLVDHYPEIYAIENAEDGSSVIINYASDDVYPLHPDQNNPDHLHPLAICGLLGQEDFCVVEERDGKHYMVAGFLASPTDWDLSMFMGKDMDGVHGEIDGYERIKKAVDSILTDLPEYPDGIFVRNNMFYRQYGLLGSMPGIAPEPNPDIITNPGEEIFLRSERETLTRLPSNEQCPDNNRFLIFTIKPHVFPLSEAAEERGERIALATKKQTKLGKSLFAPIANSYLTALPEQDS